MYLCHEISKSVNVCQQFKKMISVCPLAETTQQLGVGVRQNSNELLALIKIKSVNVLKLTIRYLTIKAKILKTGRGLTDAIFWENTNIFSNNLLLFVIKVQPVIKN